MSFDLPLISVVVPVYNQERYVGKCIRSILQQSYTNLEVIVVNDGSEDRSQLILEEMAARDQRLVLINQFNQGEAMSRKNGYLQSTGSWIVFVDSDDYLPTDSIESLYKVTESQKVDIVCGDYYRKWGPVKKYRHAFPRNMAMSRIEIPELFDSYYVSFFGINLFPVTAWGSFIVKASLIRLWIR